MTTAPQQSDLGLSPDAFRDAPVQRRPLSRKQQAVIEHCHVCGKITLAQAVELIGRNIYTNAGKHVGATLATMVKRGLLVRVRPGVFVLPNKYMVNKST